MGNHTEKKQFGHEQEPIPVEATLTEDIARKFLEACSGKLNSNDTSTMEINIKGKTYVDSQRGMIRRIAKRILGSESHLSKAIQYVNLIAEGRTHQEVLSQLQYEISQEVKLPALPVGPDLSQQMAADFLQACGDRILSSDSQKRRIVIEEQEYEDTPKALLMRVGKSIFGNSGAARLSSAYVRLIASGMKSEDAQRKLREDDADRFPDPPNISKEQVDALIAACGGSIKSGDKNEYKFSVAGIVFKDKPVNVLQRISRKIFEDKKSQTLAIDYLNFIAQGNSHQEAQKKLHKQIDKKNVLQEAALPLPPYLSPEIAESFLNVCGGSLNHNDGQIYRIKVGNDTYHDSPRNVMRRIGISIFGSRNAIKESHRYFQLVAQGCMHDECLALILDQQTKEKPALPNPPDLTREHASVLLRACGDKLLTMDNKRREIIVNNIIYEDSPNACIERIALGVYGNRSERAKSIRYIRLIAQGEQHDVAKNLAEREESVDEFIEDEDFENISRLQLEEAIALLQDDPVKLKRYLQFAHPELLEEEIDKLILRSFKGLRGGYIEKSEDKYLAWPKKLAPIAITTQIPEETEEVTLTIEGDAPGATHIFLAGVFTRRKRVEENGHFLITIPLKKGQENEVRLMGINLEKKARSAQVDSVIFQEGEADDIEALVELLSDLRTETFRNIQKDPGRYQYLCHSLEQSLIKKFGRSFHEGERYIKKLIDSPTTSPLMRRVLSTVLKKFQKIHSAEIPGVTEGSMLFFQKYCAMEIRGRIEKNFPGVILANDPGTGKTRIVQAALADRDTTVITPNPVVTAWEEEAGKVLEDITVMALHGTKHAIRKEQLKTRAKARKALHAEEWPHHTYVNREFLRNTEDKERFRLLSNQETVVVHDEAHSRSNEQSEQSKGARMLQSKFQILVTATPFKNPKTFRRMMAILKPDDQRFKSDAAFAKAFPHNDPQALKALSLLKDDVTLRFRKEDVMETVDSTRSLSQQRHKLPAKEFIPSEERGEFTMSEEQAESIYLMFTDWEEWCRRNNKYIPKDEISHEDHLRTSNGFAKRHALRQTINNPEYIGSDADDVKLKEARKIVSDCLRENRKVVIFCAYEAQALKYAEAFAKHHPALYTGKTSQRGGLSDPKTGKPLKFKKGDTTESTHSWLLDKRGYPIPDENGEVMSPLDYERITFQNADDRKILIATYNAGSVGTTFTAGKALIEDDLPADCIEAIQAEDRIHRIDPDRMTHPNVKYYSMRSKYPQKFLERMKGIWLVKDDTGYREFSSKEKAERAVRNTDFPVLNAYDHFFAQGTYDEVHGRNLKAQRTMFRLINDGIADESVLATHQEIIQGLANGNGVKPKRKSK